MDISLERRVADHLQRLVPEGALCVVAVSGGPDSLALLDLLHLGSAHHRCRLAVGHVDHGTHGDTALVAQQVAAAAAARGIPCQARLLNLPATVSETRARAARRVALGQIADTLGAHAIVLAHHADDQAETVLLRLLRGSGPAGLAGMAFRQGRWIRPALDVRRAELASHLSARGLSGWTDPANADARHLRSWLRVEVMPAMGARLPDLTERLNQVAIQARSARAAWSQVPGVLPALDLQRESDGISVAAPVLQGYRSSLRHAVLAALGRQLGLRLGARRLAAVDRLLAGPSQGGVAHLEGGYQAELAFGRLTLHRMMAAPVARVALALDQRVRLGKAQLTVQAGMAGPAMRGGWNTALIPGVYWVRYWCKGDRIRPLGGDGSRAVSVVLREARISPVRRRSWPVVVGVDDATIVWVPGICRADVQIPAEGTRAWHVECVVA